MQRRRFVLGLVHRGLFSTSKIGSAEPQPHMQPAARSLGLHLEVLHAELRPARLAGPGNA